MAIIYPTTYDIDLIKNHSEAEYKIIKAIENLDKNKTKDWIIYYSYCFKRREDKYETRRDKNNFEIDFLILAPNVGIFIFEIKGGLIQYIPGENFYSINRSSGEKYKIKPFEQGIDNYYSLNNILGKMYVDGNPNYEMKYSISGNLVGFPDIDTVPNCTFASDGHDIYVDGMDLYEFIINNSKYLQKTTNKKVPSKQLIDQIIKKLNGNKFVYSKDKKIYIDSVNLSLNDLTEEQETIFKGLIDNKRCLVKGQAGTGKTVLCEFLYKHLCEEKKYSVIYFTYNKLISEKLNNDLNTNANCKCYPIIDYLEEEYKKITNDYSLSFDNYDEKKEFLFEALGEELDKNIELTKYDCVIIDEAQDIDLNDCTIKFLDNILNKGLKDGYCYLFYDSNQKIFNYKNKKIYDSELFGDEYYRYAKYELIRNCRNGKGIRNSISSLLESKTNSNNLVNVSDIIANEDVMFYEVSESKDGAKQIDKIIKELINKGVNKSQITLLFNLTSKNNKNIIFKELNDLLPLEEFNPYKRKEISYSTVASFKGLENDVIIYINDNNYSKTLDHYVAISRAKVFTYICKVVE